MKGSHAPPTRRDLTSIDYDVLRQRASELAMNHGRSAAEPAETDWREAMRELAGLKLQSPHQTRWSTRLKSI